MNRPQRILITLAVAVFLTIVFWSGLWLGGGLIGGDLYPYFFPQKVFYAEQLAEGRIPLWNDRVGFGYPVLGESQTGALYPVNPLLYRLFDINTAYNVSQLAHYVATFAAAVWFLHIRGVGFLAALFGAGVYTYAWFPPRICLEWAILGGPYLPLGLGLIDRFFGVRKNRYLALLTIALAMHLLAGHFNLAFIECVVWTVYAVGRALFARTDDTHVEDGVGSAGKATATRRAIPVVVAIVAGFGLASYPLADTYALKNESQRVGQTDVFTPAQGHIPPIYLSQVVASWWYWYSPTIDTDAAIKRLPALVDGDTNKVEAHFYFGLIPLVLAGWGVFRVGLMRGGVDAGAQVAGRPGRAAATEYLELRRSDLLLAVIGVFAVVYATGALLPLTRHLPGFGYFIGLGRWGIVATLAVALFSARAVDLLVSHRDAKQAGLIVAGLSVVTLADLLTVSQRITYAFVTPVPPINFLDESPTKQFFESESVPQPPLRVYGPGANVLTLLGVSQWPTYLGLGPAAYWDAMPTAPEGVDAPLYSDEQRKWLADNAVSHVLTFEPVDHRRWSLEPAATIVDPVLNAIWGRGPDETVSIYRVPDAKPVIRFDPEEDGTIEILRSDSDEVIFEADASRQFDSSRVVVSPRPTSGWMEDDFDRFRAEGPLTLVDAKVSAESAGDNVGAYWLNYVPAGSRFPDLLIVVALTGFGLCWLAYFFVTRSRGGSTVERTATP